MVTNVFLPSKFPNSCGLKNGQSSSKTAAIVVFQKAERHRSEREEKGVGGEKF